MYQEYGVNEYWIVEPVDKLVDVFVLRNGKYGLIKKYVEDDVLPCVTLPDIVLNLKEVFE